MTCQEIQDLIPAYVLSALDPPDLVAVMEHLRLCRTCEAEVAAYRRVADMLPFATPATEPPPELKLRLMAQIEREAAGKLDTRGKSVTPKVTGRSRPGWIRGERSVPRIILWGAAAALVATIALGIMVIQLRSALDQQVAQTRSLQALLQRQQQINSFLTSPNMVTLNVQATAAGSQTHGRLFLSRDSQHALLVVDDLPPLPAGQVYQLWLIRDGERDSGGIFTVDEQGYGVLLVEAPHPIRMYQAIGVTNEPPGGSPGPTGTKWLEARF